MTSLKYYETKAITQLFSRVREGWVSIPRKEVFVEGQITGIWSSVKFYILVDETFFHSLSLTSFFIFFYKELQIGANR